MGDMKRASDKDLMEAVVSSRSWRAVLRKLGLPDNSSAASRSVQARAEVLGLDHSHFKSATRFSAESLTTAVKDATDWGEVAERLGLTTKREIALAKGHAARLHVETSHLYQAREPLPAEQATPSLYNLDRAGPLLAASWFVLAGFNVSWPLEPARFDLLVESSSIIQRIQVKTTTVHVGNTWKAYLSTTAGGRRTYSPEEIDAFFILDGALNMYLIPLAVVGGLQAIHLSGYSQYRLASLSSGR